MIAKLKALWPGLVGAALAVGAGLFLLVTTFGLSLVYASYDFPFPQRHRWNRPAPPEEVILIYLDDASANKLEQPPGRPWNRSIFAQLLDRLTADGAASVTFDIVFLGASPTDRPTDDQLFADAIKRNGKVTLGANPIHIGFEDETRAIGFEIIPPFEILAEQAASLGTVVQYPERDLLIRQHIPTWKQDLVAPLYWAAAEVAGAPATTNEVARATERWINYYGPPKTIPNLSIWRVLSTDANDQPPLPGFFRGKHVFVGGNFITRLATDRKDEYPTPFRSLYQGAGKLRFMSGVEVNATAFLNLLRSDWLTSASGAAQMWGIVVLGVLCGFLLIYLRPGAAAVVAFTLMALISLAGYYAFVRWRFWFPWLLAAPVIGVALAWAVGHNWYALLKEKVKIEQSLGRYLSPKLVKKFANRPEFLRTGAEKQTLSILFSDIANFTGLSEGMDGDQLAKLMNDYFDRAIPHCIFKTDGTVMKYIGDAIFAVWNAPDLQPDHAIRACRAALLLRDGVEGMTIGKTNAPLRTRIGLHTGIASIGNFGSKERFGYDAVGENINLAARMEGLNKYLGTNVLITGSTFQETNGQFVTRRLGLFRLKGFEKAVEVYELVSELDSEAKSRGWREVFARGLESYARADFAATEAAFRQALELKPEDGPSKYDLERLADFATHPPKGEWTGVVELKEK